MPCADCSPREATTSRLPVLSTVPVYSVNRRRAILLLVLSSVLLLTLDLRGNPVIDRVRSLFSRVLTPFETAGDVIVTPIKNAWHGATDYQRLEKDNEVPSSTSRPVRSLPMIDGPLGASRTTSPFDWISARGMP